MLKLIKNNQDNNCYYYIKNDQGIFKIEFGGNLDLYWSYIYEGSILKSPIFHTFTITKENYFFYNLLDELYNNIKNDNPFGDENNIYKYDKLNQNKLFEDETIKWHSDDCIYEESSILEIKKEKDDYKITFYKSKENFMSYSVRISNSGSRYGYFNIPFMNMYTKLCEYNPDYHQIHMEEYLYNEKVKKLR